MQGASILGFRAFTALVLGPRLLVPRFGRGFRVSWAKDS